MGTRYFISRCIRYSKLADVFGVSVEELMRANAGAPEKHTKKDLGVVLSVPFRAIAIAMGVTVAVLSHC